MMLLFSGDDFQIIQQEIQMMRECQHLNIVAYYGSYLRYCLHRVTLLLDSFYSITLFSGTVYVTILQCFDTVGWAAGRASGLLET